MIRDAVYEDVADLVELGIRFIESGKYKGKLTVDPETLANTMFALIDSPQGLLLVNEKGGRRIGMFGGIISFSPFSGEQVAMELFWYVEPESRGDGVRLLRRAEQWAKSLGVSKFINVSPTKKVDHFLRRMKYTALETHFIKEI